MLCCSSFFFSLLLLLNLFTIQIKTPQLNYNVEELSHLRISLKKVNDNDDKLIFNNMSIFFSTSSSLSLQRSALDSRLASNETQNEMRFWFDKNLCSAVFFSSRYFPLSLPLSLSSHAAQFSVLKTFMFALNSVRITAEKCRKNVLLDKKSSVNTFTDAA